MKPWSKLRSLLRKDKLNAEMAAEMRLHLELQTEQNVAAGMSADEACYAARRQFGGVEQIKEQCRDQRRWRWLDDCAQDLRIGLRTLLKEKGFCFAVVGVLALGICGVTTQFTIVNTSLFNLLPFPEAQQLMSLKLRDPQIAVRFAPNANIKGSDYRDFASEQQSFSRLAGYITGNRSVKIGEITRNPVTLSMEHGLFELLGVRPLLGRGFTAADDRPGAELVAVISHDWWQSEFGGRPDVVGTTMIVAGAMATIVGVMPAEFAFPRGEQLWIPLHASMPEFPRGSEKWGMTVLGRLKPGLTREQAAAEFTGVAERLSRAYPQTNDRVTLAEVVPLASDLVGPQYRRRLIGMLAAVALLLVVACSNVMNLQFVRATRRAHELSVRGALGATRGRLVRQLLTESAILAMLGGGAGVVLSRWSSELLHGLVTSSARSSEAPPTWARFELDARILGFAVAITGLTVLLSGLLPAWLSTHGEVGRALKTGGRGSTTAQVNRVMRRFVIAQIALTFPLLVASLLMTRSLSNQQNYDFGLRAAPVLVTGRFAFYGDAVSRQKLLNTLRNDPAFTHAALTTRHPSLIGWDLRHAQSFEIEGVVYADLKQRPLMLVEQISDSYFRTIGVGLLHGRDITPAEIANNADLAVINADFAEKYFGGARAVGQRYRTIDPRSHARGVWRTIVGVVPNFAQHGPRATEALAPPLAFEPLHAETSALTVVARGDAPPDSLTGPLVKAFARLFAEQPLFMVNSVKGHLYETLGETRETTRLFIVFGGVAALLASVGLYGVTAFAVRQRTQEFGVRIALGAMTSHIVYEVARRGGSQFAIGAMIGSAIAFAVGAMSYAQLEGFLYQITPFDLQTHVIVAVLLAVASTLACALPAFRAARVDPMVALRCE